MSDPSIAVAQTSDNAIVPIIDDNEPKIIEGSTDILLIAPHACIRDGEPKDDENGLCNVSGDC